MPSSDRTESRARETLLALLREDRASVERAAAEAGADDWSVFLELARRQGIAAYLGSLPRPPLPESVTAALVKARRNAEYANMLLFASIRPLLVELSRREIVPIVLKGSALLGRIYPDPGARPLSDLDLLVPADRAREAVRLLEDREMSPIACEQRAARRVGYDTQGPLPATVEIHWDLSQRHRFQADLAGLWERSIPMEFEGVAARRLAPADEFLYLSLHYAAHYFGVSLKWLVDLRELLRQDPPESGELLRRAREWHGGSGLHFAVRYLRRIYPDLGAARDLDRLVRRPARDLMISPFLSEDPLLLVRDRRRGAARLMMGLLFVDRPLDMIRLGWTTLGGGDHHDHPPAGS